MKEIVKIKEPLVLDYEKMEMLGDSIRQRLAPYSSGKVVVNDKNRKEIKKLRAELNKEYNEAEELRKHIRRQVEEPYKKFLASYKENVEAPYKEAIDSLDNEVKIIEDGIRDKKRKEVVKYAEDLFEHHKIDFVDFDMLNITINLSSSVNKLKDQVKDKVEGIVEDIELIDTQDHKERIMVEYKKTLDANNSIKKVLDSVEQEKKLEEENLRKEKQKDQTKKKEFEDPVIESNEEAKVYKMTFSVTGTIDELKSIKKFLDEGGYNYE